TPASDGQHIYAYFGSAGLYCYDLTGRLVWQKDLGTFETRFAWGTASSPIVDGERLYIQADNEKQSYVMALDKLTGEQVWRHDRDEGSNWSTPFLWKTEQRTELVTCGTNRVRSYDPQTGEVLWTLSGMSTIVIPTPFTAHGLLYVTSGYVGDRKHRPIFAIRPGARGDISLKENETSNESVAWFQPMAGPYNTTPIVVGDYLHVLYDRGIMACYHAKSGEEIYKARVTAGQGQFTASPWAYDNTLYCLNESGDTFVIPAGPEFKITRTNTLRDDMFMATPAIANNRLLIRGMNHLYCIVNNDLQ
ncbi:MAG: PQQ-binding-like beta-propeller repeat protein, partial [Planctomycetota bacterium]